MFQWLKTLFGIRPQYFPGVALDTRPPEVKANDIPHEEVAGGETVTWKTTLPDTWKVILPVRNQDGSSSCVMAANATATQGDHQLSYPLSYRDGYSQRSNSPAEGTIPMEGLQIVANKGLCKDSRCLSDDLGENIMDIQPTRNQEFIDEALQVAGGIPIKFTTIDIDSIAAVVDKGLHPRLCFQFAYNEWTAIPQLISKGGLRHCVTAVDRAIVNGKKCIIIQDSWGQNSYMFPTGHRAISEDFLNERCFFAGYILYPSPISPIPAPQHIFTVDMRFGDNSNEVKLLQEKLKSLGLFVNINTTGYFGPLTRSSVIAFQAQNNLPQTGFCGPMTRNLLNSGV